MGLKTPMRCPLSLSFSPVSTPSVRGHSRRYHHHHHQLRLQENTRDADAAVLGRRAGTEGEREHLSTGRACAVMYGASERALPRPTVRPPLGGLGAIVGAIADMRGMDGGIWHGRKGEHGKGAFLGEATVQSKCVVPPRARFHPSSTGLPSQVEKEGPNTSTLRAGSTVAEMPNRGGPDSEN